jgi:inorganic pyrophosphatase
VTIESNEAFWKALDNLINSTKLVIDRPKGTHRPGFPEMVYPVDYGYLENTTSMDGNGIDVWRGTKPSGKIDAIICTVDLTKRDSEIKLLIGCTVSEKKVIMSFHNRGELMKGLILERAAHDR